MAYRNLSALVFVGFDAVMASTLLSTLGNDGLPQDIRIHGGLNSEPWQSVRTGLMVIGMDPRTDLVRVSQLLENRPTYWEVAVCIPAVLSYYSVALLAQGAVKVMPHPMDDLEATRRELKTLLKTLASLQSDALGLEVSDLIQLYGDKRVAKTIRLTGGGCVGSIYLHNGMVVHADTMDEEEGMTALQRLLAIRNPEIRVHKGALTDKKSIGIPAMSALLEGSRQMDEAERKSTSVLDDPELMDIIPDDPRPATDSMDGIAMFTEHSNGPSVKPGAKSLFSDEDLDLG